VTLSVGTGTLAWAVSPPAGSSLGKRDLYTKDPADSRNTFLITDTDTLVLHSTPHQPQKVQAPIVHTWSNSIKAHLVSIGHFLFSSRDYLFPITFFVLLLTTLPTFPFGSTRADGWLDVLGILVACFGQGCRFLAAGCADNIRRRGYQGQIGAKALIEDGVYAHVRNPLYLGNFLIVTGFVLIANNLWWYLLVLPGFGFIYYAIVTAEEDLLLKTFGDRYAGYCHKVKRFVPRLRGLHQNLAACPFYWKRALRREYGNVCSWGSMIFVLLIWERWERFGYWARAVEIDELVVSLLLLFLAYGIVLWCKRTGKLRS
jgi:protein-S-isoprenylcysteine O-methyltransferase Ste14